MNTNYADGVAFVNQCPITPRDSFTYEFQPTNQAVFASYQPPSDSVQLNRIADIRGPIGITAITTPSTAMACVGPW